MHGSPASQPLTPTPKRMAQPLLPASCCPSAAGAWPFLSLERAQGSVPSSPALGLFRPGVHWWAKRCRQSCPLGRCTCSPLKIGLPTLCPGLRSPTPSFATQALACPAGQAGPRPWGRPHSWALAQPPLKGPGSCGLLCIGAGWPPLLPTPPRPTWTPGRSDSAQGIGSGWLWQAWCLSPWHSWAGPLLAGHCPGPRATAGACSFPLTGTAPPCGWRKMSRAKGTSTLGFEWRSGLF